MTQSQFPFGLEELLIHLPSFLFLEKKETQLSTYPVAKAPVNCK